MAGKRSRLPRPCIECNENWGSIIVNRLAKHVPTISIRRPKPKITVAYKECLGLSEAINIWADPDIDLIESRYPEFINENLQFFARGICTYGKLFEPFIDLRWSKCWIQWLKIERDMLNYGAHAAASKNYTESNVCAICKDQTELKRTLESPCGWLCLRCGCTRGLRVQMTAKQVKNKSQAVLRMAWLICSDIPPFNDFLSEVKRILASDLVLRNEYLKRLEDYSKKERHLKINEEMISSLLSSRRKPNQIRPKSMKTIAYENTLYTVRIISKCADQLKNFPPEIQLDAEHIADGIRKGSEFFVPLTDLDQTRYAN